MLDEMDEPPPWLRLYRRGSARFQQLEPHYRGTLIEVLRYTDSSGRINLDGRSPEEALLRLLGNTRSFRPVLKAALAEGLRIEMLKVIDGHLVFQSWSKYQPNGCRSVQSKRFARAKQRRRNDVAEASQEQNNDLALAPKSSKSLDLDPQRREEKRRGEENRNDVVVAARDVAPAETIDDDGSELPSPPRGPSARKAYARAIEAVGGIFDGGAEHHGRWRRIEGFAARVAERTGQDPQAVLDGWASRYVAERSKRSPAWWLERVEVWAGEGSNGSPAGAQAPQVSLSDAKEATRLRLREQQERIERERLENERIARERFTQERGTA